MLGIMKKQRGVAGPAPTEDRRCLAAGADMHPLILPLGLDEILVVEEKRQIIEYQLKEQLYNEPRPPASGGQVRRIG
jgi:hypothetical protein